MKRIICAIMLTALLYVPSCFASEWVKFSFPKDTVLLRKGLNEQIPVTIQRKDTSFKASIYILQTRAEFYSNSKWKNHTDTIAGMVFTVRKPAMILFSSNGVINYPYVKQQKMTLISNECDTGFFRHCITIKNGSKVYEDTLYVRCVPHEQWKSLYIPTSNKPIVDLYVTNESSVRDYIKDINTYFIPGSDSSKLILYNTGGKTYIDQKKKLWLVSGSIISHDGQYQTEFRGENSEWLKRHSKTWQYEEKSQVKIAEVNNRIYVSAYHGLYTFVEDTLVELTHSEPLFHPNRAISDFAANPKNNNLYVVETGYTIPFKGEIIHDDILMFDGVQWQKIPLDISASQDTVIHRITNIRFDKEGILFCLVNKKLAKYDSTGWHFVSAEGDSSLLKKFIHGFESFEFDRNNNLWLITYNSSLVEFNDNMVKRVFNTSNSPFETTHSFFHIDSSNIFYFPLPGYRPNRHEHNYVLMFSPDGTPLPQITTDIKSDDNIFISKPLDLHPNPADKEVYISLPNNKNIHKITITNVSGAIQLTKTHFQNMEEIRVATDTLTNGLYTLTIYYDDGNILCEKLCVLH